MGQLFGQLNALAIPACSISGVHVMSRRMRISVGAAADRLRADSRATPGPTRKSAAQGESVNFLFARLRIFIERFCSAAYANFTPPMSRCFAERYRHDMRTRTVIFGIVEDACECSLIRSGFGRPPIGKFLLHRIADPDRRSRRHFVTDDRAIPHS